METFWTTDLKTHFNKHLARVLTFVILFLYLLPFTVSADESVPNAQSFASLVVDAKRGQILFARNANERVQSSIASKMMTALIALETAKPDAMITASNEAATIENASMNLRIGEKYSVDALVYALMLNNSDDAALTLAEYIGGDVNSFVAKMNETAKKIGMTNTYFSNPTGAPNQSQLTTAADIALFLQTALNNTAFSRVFGAQAKPWYDDQKTILLTNQNGLFWGFEGTDGGMATKSGEGLFNYVTSATQTGLQLLLIQLDAPVDVVEEEAARLLSDAFDRFRYGTLVSSGQILKTISVEGQTLNLVPATIVRYVYPAGESFVSDLSISVNDKLLKPPILKTSVIGVATYTLDDGTMIQVDLYPDRDLLPKKTRYETIKDRLLESKELLIIIGLLIVLEMIVIATKFAKAISVHIKKKNQAEDEPEDN